MVSYNPNDDRLPGFISSSSKINRGYWRIALPCLVRSFSFWPSWCRNTCVTACHSPFFIWNKTIRRLLYYNAHDIFVQHLITVWLLCAKKKIVLLWKKIEVDTSRRVDQAKRRKKTMHLGEIKFRFKCLNRWKLWTKPPVEFASDFKNFIYIYIIRENAVQLTYKERTSMNI